MRRRVVHIKAIEKDDLDRNRDQLRLEGDLLAVMAEWREKASNFFFFFITLKPSVE